MWPTDTDIDNDRPTWTPIDKAAELSGKSDRTLRRWVASGKLRHRREAGRLYVDLSSPALTGGDSGQDSDIASELTEARQQIATLTAELASVKAVLSEVIGERDYLRQALAMSLTLEQKRLEAATPPARPWRWPWQKTEG